MSDLKVPCQEEIHVSYDGMVTMDLDEELFPLSSRL